MKTLNLCLLAGFAGLIILPSAQFAAKIVVKASDPQSIAPFCLSITPLVSYPGALQETREAFGDCYVVELPQSLDPLQSIPGTHAVWAAGSGSVIPLIENPLRTLAPCPDSSWGGPYEPDDEWFSTQWDRAVTRIDWAWNVTKGSKDVLVAILDTGVDTTHPDLRTNLVAGYNFVDTSATVQDGHGHGTAVSGVVAAEIDNLIGVAGIAQASIMPLKVVADNGYYQNADLIQGILYASDHRARAINMSLGGSQDTLLARAIDYAWQHGVFICAAAGNSGADSSLYPAAYPNVVSVGYTTEADERGSGSHYGRNVDIFAPGVQVASTSLGGGYGAFTGSSIASPEIAGLAALVLSLEPYCTNRDVRDAILASADTIDVDIGRVPRMSAGLFASSARFVQKDTLRFDYASSKPASYTLTFFDAAGRKVSERQGSTAELGRIDFKPLLPSGVYFWVMSTSYGASSGKIVYFK